MLRLLNHSEGLKMRVSETKKHNKKCSDKQPSRQTNYTEHQTGEKCTATVDIPVV